MLNRFWQWTSAPAVGAAETSIPHGPLRFRSWTSDDGPQQATVIPHGPFRFRPWTSGPAVDLPVPPEIIIGGVPFLFPGNRLLREDEEIMAVILAWLHTQETLQ